MIIPESISALVWQMQHKWLWTVGMVTGAIGMMALMMSASEGNSLLELLAFLSCTCIAFVGAIPLVVSSANKAHYVLAIVGAVLSQAWCIALAVPQRNTLLIYISLWLFAAMLAMLFRRHWCLIAEIACVVAILLTCFVKTD